MSGKSVNWTKEQKQVIESRGSNLLVSAAAGSGKTAVLVERIIRMVTEDDAPLDIDKLLVMTFTNAAAAEMRERIGAAIEAKLQEDPGNDHLQVQAALVHHAQITTIDSFCLSIIRNHFNMLDLDPSFRIGDEGELTLIKADVMQELLEDYYQNGGASYERFVETYVPGKSDAGLEDYIMQVYTFSQSNPYPDLWFEQCRKELDGSWAEDGEHIPEQLPWIRFLMEDVKRQIKELRAQMTEALEICRMAEGLPVYEPMFSQDVRQLDLIAKTEHLEDLFAQLQQITWTRLAAVRSKEVDPELKAYVSACRDRTKKAVTKLKEQYCFEPLKEMWSDMQKTAETVTVLLELAEEFSRRYQEKKKERNIVDFDDLEHGALRVLIRMDGGEMNYTEVADAFSNQFEEVLVDEYQDSNLVQEALIHAVSRERFGQHNVFMVGDVKQSIYKFRLARPELFLEKYHSYEDYDGAVGSCRKIELHQNFRSRKEVLDGINDMFYQIMTENLGNIRYTEDAALHPGAVFPDGIRTAGVPELLLMDTSDAALSEMDPKAADYTSKELEAKMIVRRIREMTDPETGLQIWDKKLNGTGGYRVAQYRDIVILLRSTMGWTENLLAILMNEGIPAYAESRTGYFNTIEVEMVLSLLAVIDNPMQDIPLAAVLKSPIVGLTDQQLAQMMACFKSSVDKGQDRGIYAAMQWYLEHLNPQKQDDTAVKLFKFRECLTEFRRESAYLSIHELLYHIFERTGYYHYVSAMPAGEIRKANLDMLVEKASAYEKTSYKGLFHFIRYIENLKKYNTDFGEASTVGEEDNTIRIMSIHKSKGLEFPIVFLAGTGKKFNRQDVYGKILIDPELGIGTEYLDLEHRVSTTTLKRNVLRRKMELDNLGEELRVLYVAMTRAKEQLVITGTSRYLEKTMEKYAKIPLADGQIPYTVLASAGSYLDWILMCLGGNPVGISVRHIPVTDLVGEELVRQVESRYSKEQLVRFDTEKVYDPAFRRELTDLLSSQYAYEADIGLHTKMSVSELKKQGQMTDEGESVCMEGPMELDWNMLPEREPESCQKPWISDEETEHQQTVQAGGAERGTAYHRVLELLRFDQMESPDDVQTAIADLRHRKKISESIFKSVDAKEIWKFLQSNLGKRMRVAQKEGRLHKEQQFVMGVPAREMRAADSDELVVIQGIIDAYMEENGQLVIIDYKSDRVWNPQILVDHYKRQLDYYERALTQMTGKHVKEKVIYSLTMHREIYL